MTIESCRHAQKLDYVKKYTVARFGTDGARSKKWREDKYGTDGARSEAQKAAC